MLSVIRYDYEKLKLFIIYLDACNNIYVDVNTYID